MSCAIKNNSSKTIKLTKFQVFSTGSGSVPIEITDEVKLGYLSSGETRILQFRLSHVYEPGFKWEFECDGHYFSAYGSYKQ